MKRRILTYLQQIDELIQDPPEDTDWDRAIHNHLTQIQFFQHERLIHLIVTVLFALMTTSVVVGLVGTGSIWLTLLLIPLLILLFPYINHYYLLENGVACYSGLGDGYERNDCYWEVIKHSDQSHDGIREIQFDAICYIPESSIPYFTEQYITNTDSELYDYYTGIWFTAATAYGNSQRGDNYYVHTVNYNGNEYLIEFAYSTDWQYNVSDWAMVLTKSYMVYLPDDYDGLVFAAMPQLDNYKDCARRMQLDSIAPEASIMDIDLVDPYNTLFFSICY